MAVVCPSCQKEFKCNQGLSKHRRTCRTALATTASLLHKRKQNRQRKLLAKVARNAEKHAIQDQRIVDLELEVLDRQREVSSI